jgi:isoleucyl-tRNA synthetase
MDGFNCTRAGESIAAFVDRLSNWYVRLNRRRFWEGDAAAFATLRHCLVETAKLLAPFTPFVADEIYSNLTGDGDSVHLADFPEPDAALEDGELEAGVEAAMRAIELGRAARAAAKVKNRQPLHRAVIVATDAERSEIERLADLVRAELNVKALEFVAEEGELVRYTVKPNFRTLGPRFGKSMPQVVAAVESLDPGHVAEAIRGERRMGVNVDGSEHVLEPDDLALVMQPLDGYEVEAEAGRAVALALELDDELVREGLAREIVHAVQNARKRAGLDVSDRISLTLGGDEGLIEAARSHEGYIAGETLATSVAYDGAQDVAASIEGRELEIGIERAKS